MIYASQSLGDLWNWLLQQFAELCGSLGIPEVIRYMVEKGAYAVGLLVFISLTALVMIYMERKVSAHMQLRYGPMWTGGWHGWSQTIADMIKLLLKEDIIPDKADRWVHSIAPIVIFVPSLIGFLVIPFDKYLIGADLNVGILLVFGFSSIAVLSIFMGGWASNNKYTLLGGLRSAAQMISYELPLVLSVLGVIMTVGSLKMSDIVMAQKDVWFLFTPNLLGFIIYIIAGTAEVNRTPFDLPEAESELVSGYNTEYSGLKYGFFMLSEFTNTFIISAIAATFFMGGWNGPSWLPGIVSFLAKTYLIVFLLMWFRWTFPRLRVDRLMDFGWKFLLPLSFFNILMIAVWVLVKK